MSGVTIEWDQEPETRSRQMQEEAERISRRLAAMGATKVILFGSRARGEAGAHSDLDLLAVMPCDPGWTFARRLAEVGAAVDPRLATDLLVYTPEEFSRLRETSPFLRRVLCEGRILYERSRDEAP